MAKAPLPVITTDVYMSRARRYVTLEGPAWEAPMSFQHLSQALDFLRLNDTEEVLLVAGDHKLVLRFAGPLSQQGSGHASKAKPSGQGVGL